jgi:hypothetical protein
MKKLLAATACAAALSACSPVPAPQFFPPSQQEVVASAAHWQVMADDFADSLAPAIKGEARVVRPLPSTNFSEAFGDMLSSDLVSRHVSLTVLGMAPVHVRYGVELVQNGYAMERMGPATRLGNSGVWRAQDSHAHERHLVPPDFPMSGPITEIVVTATVERAGHDLYSMTRTYYVRGTDAQNYLPPPPPPAVHAMAPRPEERVVVIDRYGERTLMMNAPLR